MTQDPFEDTQTATYQERLAQMDLQKIAKVNQPSWRRFRVKRIAKTYLELKEWNLKERALNRPCNCYRFNNVCWEISGES